jgi:hypothetical protein
MMGVTIPLKEFDRQNSSNTQEDNSVSNLMSPLLPRAEAKIKNDTFIYHQKNDQEIADTRNLFNYLEQKHIPPPPQSADHKLHRKQKYSNNAKLFKYKGCETPGELSDTSPLSYGRRQTGGVRRNGYDNLERAETMTDYENQKRKFWGVCEGF